MLFQCIRASQCSTSAEEQMFVRKKMFVDENPLLNPFTQSSLNDNLFYLHPRICETEAIDLHGINRFCADCQFSSILFNLNQWSQRNQQQFHLEWVETTSTQLYRSTSSTPNYVPLINRIDNVTHANVWPNYIHTATYPLSNGIPTFLINQLQPHSNTYVPFPTSNFQFTQTRNSPFSMELQTQVEPTPKTLCNMQTLPLILQPDIEFVSSGSAMVNDNAEKASLKTSNLEGWGNIVQQFKQRRINLGYSLEAVSIALTNLYGKGFSRSVIAKFEASRLNVRKMSKLRLLLPKWLDEAASNCSTQTVVSYSQRKRKKYTRTVLKRSTKLLLEGHFNKIKKPAANEITQISQNLQLDKKVVQLWYVFLLYC